MSNDLEPMRAIAKGFLQGQIASNVIKEFTRFGKGFVAVDEKQVVWKGETLWTI